MASPPLVRRKSPLRGLFRRNGKPLFASLSARVFRKEALPAQGFRIHRACRWFRNTARRAAALRTSQKAFLTVWGDRVAAVSFFMRVIVTFLAAQTRRRGKKTQIRSVAYA